MPTPELLFFQQFQQGAYTAISCLCNHVHDVVLQHIFPRLESACV